MQSNKCCFSEANDLKIEGLIWFSREDLHDRLVRREICRMLGFYQSSQCNHD